VNHIIVFYDGKAKVTYIDSLNENEVFCTNKDSTKTSYLLDQIYFIYNDFGKMFYSSPSLQFRMDYIENYGGTLISVDKDTFQYKKIEFNRNMRNSMAYITTEADSFIAVPLLNIYRIDTDLAFMEQSVKRGFYTAISGFLLATTFQIIGDYFDKREPESSFGQKIGVLSSAVWDQGNDILPKVSAAGLKENGVTYQSLTFLTPISTISWMAFDYFFEWKSNYFRPFTLSEPYPKQMKVINITTLIKSYIKR